MKSKRGITLVALVVTIIVLLILSAVGISLLTGENGILNKAKIAKVESDRSSIEEEGRLNKTNDIMENFTISNRAISSGFSLDYDNMQNLTSSLNTVNQEYTFTKSGQLYVQAGIDSQGWYYTTIKHSNIEIGYVRFHNSSGGGEQYTDHVIVNEGDKIIVTHKQNIQANQLSLNFIPFK
ncbi:hypothetical protein D3C72_1780600 [compost metagenome]